MTAPPAPPPLIPRLAALVAAVVGLPLAGAWLRGRPLAEFFRFPPPDFTPAAGQMFSWWAAAAVIAVLVATLAPWIRLSAKTRQADPGGRAPGLIGRSQLAAASQREDGRPRLQFRAPRIRIVLALAWTLAWWVIAWSRSPALAVPRANSFLPLWAGFIVLVRALSAGRVEARSPGGWAALFAGSAAFWWGFEWLNRFAGDWHYPGVEGYGALGYAAHATLCFSTVLPAVAAVSEALASLPRWRKFTRHGPPWPWLGSRAVGGLWLAAGAASLFFVGLRPQFAYPALWVAPLLFIAGDGLRRDAPGPWRELSRGNWHPAASWMAAALLCGFLWELWNFRSFPKWTYTVPYVNGAHLFEMPLLGYAGYLAFGLECWAAASGLSRLPRGGGRRLGHGPGG